MDGPALAAGARVAAAPSAAAGGARIRGEIPPSEPPAEDDPLEPEKLSVSARSNGVTSAGVHPAWEAEGKPPSQVVSLVACELAGRDAKASWTVVALGTAYPARIEAKPRLTKPPNCAVEYEPNALGASSPGDDCALAARPTPAKPTSHSPITSRLSSSSIPAGERKTGTENGTGPILAIEVSRHGPLRVAGLRVPPRDARPTRRAVRRFQAETLGNPFLPFRRAIRPPALDAAA